MSRKRLWAEEIGNKLSGAPYAPHYVDSLPAQVARELPAGG